MKDEKPIEDRTEIADNLRRIRLELADRTAYARAFCRAVLGNFRTGLAVIPNPALYGERLESERLSAEFKSPLTRSNLRRKLKRGRGPVQLGMFEPAPEPERQQELF